MKILTLPKMLYPEHILGKVNTIKPYLKVEDITFIINEKDRPDSPDNILLDCYNPENEKIRIKIKGMYI